MDVGGLRFICTIDVWFIKKNKGEIMKNATLPSSIRAIMKELSKAVSGIGTKPKRKKRKGKNDKK
tara:strand:+ start:1649 stop:1843 length:195 start_codon:yes stop_codon:yes gene_type:complete